MATAVERSATAPRVGAPAAVEGSRPPRPKPFDQPRFLKVFTVLVFLYLFAPIFIVFLFSFNSKRSTQIFGSFSLRWYNVLIHDSSMLQSLQASIEIGFVTMLAGTVVGTLLAFGLVRSRSRVNRPTDVIMLLNLVSPEIVTAIALLLVFSEVGSYLTQFGLKLGLSLTTIALGHITWSIPYVTIIVRGRLATLNREVEEAAQDLGATNVQALRLVTLPQLWPAIVASALLVFVMSFDDFVTSYFLSGVDLAPLPIRIYTMIHFGVTPEVNAIGTVMMLVTITIVLIALFIYSRQQRARLTFLAE